ncbi:hypothetical protein [Actinomycetospora sp. NBRC 106378]|uniref:hypothetical protein n=1 Tax=Actinomycetospora sp. NBRC 106378 TaxID=3032208 RepID=UPI0024A366FD|nr:hypothetical protein [Actinomycetospora sp. NBRC 106378]GLZ52750.1 hypothetical protein Acsp07_23670 [Actinomycetospora sp. NBRC 106378]
MTTTTVTVVRPALPRTPFAIELAAWIREGVDGHPLRTDGRRRPAVVIVPEYLHTAPRTLLADLATARWAGRPVGLIGYGGRTRARYALEDARDALRGAGATLVGPSVGLDVARVRAAGFDPADVLLRDLVLDELAAA